MFGLSQSRSCANPSAASISLTHLRKELPMSFFRLSSPFVLVPSLVAASLALSACSSSKDSTPVNPGPAGGPVAGAADAHCGSTKQPTDPKVCMPVGGGAGGGAGAGGMGAGGMGAGGMGAGGGGDMPDVGATMVGSEGDDDDCKYHVAWTSTPVYENQDVTFTVTVTKKVGDAVERNRIRRRLREALRITGDLPLRDDHDYVLVARREALSEDFRALCEGFRQALNRLNDPARATKAKRPNRNP